MAKQLIRIANPIPGGSQYTSMRVAIRQQQLGHADIVEGVLIFRRDVQERKHTSAERIRMAQEAPVDSRGMIWWNGCKGERARFPPFCNVSIPRPDARI